jgi:hypothetical protein
MTRSWGFSDESIALLVTTPGIWNLLFKLLLPRERVLTPEDTEMTGVLAQVSNSIRDENGIGEIIFSQTGARRASAARSADGHAIEREMISPMIGARVEESDVFTTAWRNRPNVRSLGAIAKRACVAQVVGFSRPAMFFRDDVIDLASEKSFVLMDQTIFAQLICPRCDASA